MTAARRIEATRAYLSASALVGATLLFWSLAILHRVFGVAAAAIATLVLLWRFRAVFSRDRVTLWLEERAPELRFALAALADHPDTRFLPRLDERVRAARFGRPLALAGVRLIGVPLALLLVSEFVARPIIARRAAATAAGISPASRGRDAIGGAASFAAIVTAPRYARIATDTVENPVAVAALVGSDIAFFGRWTARATMPPRPTVMRLGSGTSERLVALEPRADSAPTVVLELPARDTVVAAATGTLTLAASARDDIGIVSGWFEMIVSSGSGESFKFRSGTFGRALGNNARTIRLAGVLRLDSLSLEPGDVVHLRAVARDGNPAAGAEIGSSETRTLRVFRAGDADSVAIEGAPAPEVGKSELSQRMLIMLAEKLVAQTRKLSRAAVVTESGTIGRDQARLRKRVGDIIFTRLTGEEPPAEDTANTAADTLPPAEALLRAASAATGAGAGEALEAEGSDAPVVAINRPLLEAFNAMWDAERRLGIGEPREALPHMRAALAAIQKARAAERLYLRGRPPRIVVDIPRIRLSGKKDGIDPGARSPRASEVTAALSRQAKFRAALQLFSSEGGEAAAVDSLTLLRIDALADQPQLAAALSVAIDDVRAGRDATVSLRAARRALAEAPQQGGRSRWNGVW